VQSQNASRTEISHRYHHDHQWKAFIPPVEAKNKSQVQCNLLEIFKSKQQFFRRSSSLDWRRGSSERKVSRVGL